MEKKKKKQPIALFFPCCNAGHYDSKALTVDNDHEFKFCEELLCARQWKGAEITDWAS